MEKRSAMFFVRFLSHSLVTVSTNVIHSSGFVGLQVCRLLQYLAFAYKQLWPNLSAHQTAERVQISSSRCTCAAMKNRCKHMNFELIFGNYNSCLYSGHDESPSAQPGPETQEAVHPFLRMMRCQSSHTLLVAARTPPETFY